MIIPTMLCVQIWAGCTAIMLADITREDDTSWERVWKVVVSIAVAPGIATVVVLDNICKGKFIPKE